MNKKERKKRIEKDNTKIIDRVINAIEEEELVTRLQENLVSYLSLALRNTHYYGNLNIKYVSFNFTFNAFFASILAIFIAIISDINFSLWYLGLPIIIGLVLYFFYFLILLIVKFDTISFKIYSLQHYTSIMDRDDYPYIRESHEIQNLLKLILKEKSSNRERDLSDNDKDKEFNNKGKEQNDKKNELNNKMKELKKKEKERTGLDLVKNDLKALVLQYLYQANYDRVAVIMRNCSFYFLDFVYFYL